MEGLLFASVGHYEEAVTRFDAAIDLGRHMGRPVSVLLNYSTMAYRELHDLGEARRRSEESLSNYGRSSSFHMPWMNAIVDLIHCDVLDGEVGAAETKWLELWDDVLSTPAWERWFLGGKMAAFRAEIELQKKDPQTAAEWAERAVVMARQVHRVKYESVARGVLGKSLLALDRHQEALHQLEAAVKEADSLRNPFGRWRAKADLARAFRLTGNDGAAEQRVKEAAAIIRDVAAGLATDRAKRFLEAPAVAEVLKPS